MDKIKFETCPGWSLIGSGGGGGLMPNFMRTTMAFFIWKSPRSLLKTYFKILPAFQRRKKVDFI